MQRYKQLFKERQGDFTKDTDKWFDDLSAMSKMHFEKNKPQQGMKEALEIADKFLPFGGRGSTDKEFQRFKDEIMWLPTQNKYFKRFGMFLKKLSPGDYDMDTRASEIDELFPDYATLSDWVDNAEYDDPIFDYVDNVEDADFRHWSNDVEGNSSVVNSIMELYNQAITYSGNLEDYNNQF